MAKKKASLVNWYGTMPKDMIPKYHNPCFEDHKISVPFRGLIVGGSGSGKTTLVLELLHRMYDTFGHVTIYTMNAEEPLYKFLESKIKPQQLTIK
jgi:GTPase SAR1 family protein